MPCISQFTGIVPRLDNGSLPPSAATIAENVDLSNGTIKPWLEPRFVENLGDDIKSFHVRDCCFRGVASACARFVDNVMGTRTYLSDPCDCPMEIADFCTGDAKYLGFPQPAPAFVASDDEPDDAWTELRSYYITYGDDCREGRPSLPSNLIKANKDSMVVVGLPPLPEDNKYPVTKAYIYCSASTYDITKGYQSMNESDVAAGFFDPFNSQVECFLVACVDIGTEMIEVGGSLVDGEGNTCRTMTSQGFCEPPDGLIIVGETDQKRLVGFKGNCVYFSEANTPWGWPKKHKQTIPCDIRDVCVIGNTVIVLTDANPFLIIDDAECTAEASGARTVSRVATPYPLCSQKSVVCGPNGVTFASNEGLIYLDLSGAARILSRTHYSDTDWLAVDPCSIVAAQYKDSYVFASDTASGVFDLNLRGVQADVAASLSTHCIQPRCFLTDKQGSLYFMDACGNVFQWNDGSDFLPYTYQTPHISMGGPRTIGAFELDYAKFNKKDTVVCPTSVTGFRDGQEQKTRVMKHSRPTRWLMQSACEVGFRLCGTEEVRMLCFGTSLSELRN